MEQEKLKILIVQPHLSIYGGAETVVARLANCLNREGIKADVMTLSLSAELACIFENVGFITPEKEYTETVRSVSFWKSLGIVNEILALNRLLRKYACSYDVINVHNFPATWAVTQIKKPIVWMCNEPPDLYCNPNPSLPLRFLRQFGVVIDRLIVNKYVKTICVADNYNARRAFQRYGRELEIIPYGIDYDLFANSDVDGISRKYDLSQSFIMLQVGVLSPEKNQLESIKTLEALKDSIPNLKLVLVGKGTSAYEEDLKKYILHQRLDDQVIFTGHLSKGEVGGLYHLCNTALFPVKSQGGWLSPFEALSAGKPIVVSPTMGAAELIKRNKIGIITEDFPEAVKDVYSRPSIHKEIAEKGKRWVDSNLSWEVFATKMLGIFKRSLKERRFQ